METYYLEKLPEPWEQVPINGEVNSLPRQINEDELFPLHVCLGDDDMFAHFLDGRLFVYDCPCKNIKSHKHLFLQGDDGFTWISGAFESWEFLMHVLNKYAEKNIKYYDSSIRDIKTALLPFKSSLLKEMTKRERNIVDSGVDLVSEEVGWYS